jgi:hypothetical protein
VRLLDYFVKIIYRSHLLEITSMVETSFPLIPCDHLTLFTLLPRETVQKASMSVGSKLQESPKWDRGLHLALAKDR